MARPCQVVVLISGGGSNLQALIDSIASDESHPAQLSVVISNRADAYGLVRAAAAGIPTQVLDHRQHAGREAFDAALMHAIDAYRPDLVVLAGFMRILTPGFVRHYGGRLLNIHPSLLPRHKGLDTHARALQAGDAEHGCSVHFVTEDLDGGPLVAQAATAIQADDDAQSLALRVRQLEHRLYPRVVRWFAEGRLRLANEGVMLDNQPLPAGGLPFQD